MLWLARNEGCFLPAAWSPSAVRLCNFEWGQRKSVSEQLLDSRTVLFINQRRKPTKIGYRGQISACNSTLQKPSIKADCPEKECQSCSQHTRLPLHHHGVAILPHWHGQAAREKDSLIDAKATTANMEGVSAGNGDSFGPMGSIPPLTSGDQNAQRRSQRVIAKVSVMILADESDNKAVSEEMRTITVNAHGAMILLGLKISIGQLLTLRNSRAGEEVACRVVYVSPHESEKRQVGVDFIEPCLDFGASPFLHLIGQLEVQKPKATQAGPAAHRQIQNRRNEIRVSI
jgi:hypothetical protein